MTYSDGGGEGIVLMRRGENPSEVLKGIHEAVDELNSTPPYGPGEQHAAYGIAHFAVRKT